MQARPRVLQVCQHCYKEFIEPRNRKNKFCSQECFILNRKELVTHRLSGKCSQCSKIGLYRMGMCCSCYQKWLRTSGPSSKANSGQCEGCEKPFFSRTKKKYCSMTCYYQSGAFAKMSRECATRRRRRVDTVCLQCGSKMQVIPSHRRKFCNMPCCRKWFAERFDRWVASPQGLTLPQCYDEFLSHNVLPCLIEGCQWFGSNLSGHVNLVHGIKADRFKEMVGFNRHTGVVGYELAKRLSEASLARVDDSPLSTPGGFWNTDLTEKPEIRPEGREHCSKSSAVSYSNGSALRRHNERNK